MALAIYCRVSTPAQAKNTSFESQQSQGEEYAKLNGERDYKIFKDVYTGTKSAGREDWLKLIEGIKTKKYDKVLYFFLDRLARDTIDGLQFLQTLETYNVALYKYGVGKIEYTDPDVRMLLTIEFCFAEREAKKIKERTGRGKARSIDGGHHRYNKLYGYEATDSFDQKSGKRIWKLIQAEKDCVLEIYRCVIDKKMTLRSICKRLNELGFEPKHTAHWSVSSVSNILKQPAYCGKMYDTKKKLVDGDVYEKIMEYEYWKQAQVEYVSCITAKQNNGYSVKYPAVNIIKCKRCSAAYMINESVSKYHYKTRPNEVKLTRRIHYYHDSKVKCEQMPKYLQFHIINWIAEDVFIKALSERDNSLIKEMLHQIDDTANAQRADIERIENHIKELEKEIANYSIAISKGLDIDFAVIEIQKRKNEIMDQNKKVESIKRSIALESENYEKICAEFSLDKIVDYLNGSGRKKRDMLKRLLKKATIDDDTIEFILLDGRTYTYNYEVFRQNEYKMNLRQGGYNPDINIALIHLIESAKDENIIEEAKKWMSRFQASDSEYICNVKRRKVPPKKKRKEVK
jgi:DNA invertase Pin-like site-specific DNA recombinase